MRLLYIYTCYSHILSHTNRDTLFYDDFSLSSFLAAFHQSPATASDGAFIPYYTCPDEGTTHTHTPYVINAHTITHTPTDTSRRGILELDDTGKVVSFLEKPLPTETTSRKAVSVLLSYNNNNPSTLDLSLPQNPCLYLFTREVLPLLSKFLEEKQVSVCVCE